MKTKKCPRCLEIKDILEFHRNQGRKDGRFPYCKMCNNSIRSKSGYDYQKLKLTNQKPEKKLKIRARYLTGKAVKNGKLKKEISCQICGDTKNIQCHHVDYTDPLNVRWLCPYHHSEADRKIINP